MLNKNPEWYAKKNAASIAKYFDEKSMRYEVSEREGNQFLFASGISGEGRYVGFNIVVTADDVSFFTEKEVEETDKPIIYEMMNTWNTAIKFGRFIYLSEEGKIYYEHTMLPDVLDNIDRHFENYLLLSWGAAIRLSVKEPS